MSTPSTVTEEMDNVFIKEENMELCIEPCTDEYLHHEIKIEPDFSPEPEIDRDLLKVGGQQNSVQDEVRADLPIPDETLSVNQKFIESSSRVYQNGTINRVKCNYCSSTFKNRANMKQHLRFVHPSKDDAIECTECFRLFKSISHLRSHMASVHGEIKEVTCNKCQKVFANDKKLKNHIFYTHPDPNAEVSCVICKKTFKQHYNLKIHLNKVHSTEEIPVECETCKKVFKNDMLLKKHVKWSHSDDGMMYRCQVCSRMLPSLLCFKRHMKNVHSEQNLTCSVCSKSVKSYASLQRHMKTVHSTQSEASTENEEEKKPDVSEPKKKDFKCLDCDKEFSKNTALLWHVERNHSENKRTTYCNICQRDYSDYYTLKRHNDLCHSFQNSLCDICNKCFKTPSSLQKHIKVTHAPPEAQQTCEICRKTYKCILHLRVHMHAVHSNKGSSFCDVCNKEFSSRKYMVKHRKIHDDIGRQHPCYFCKATFKSDENVKKHIKRVHKLNISDVHKCNECNLDFPNYQTLQLHFEQHKALKKLNCNLAVNSCN